jgi:hypothetical protein
MSVTNDAWWSSLRHGGLLIAPSRLSMLRASPPEPIGLRLADRLRADVTRLATGTPEARRELLDTVFDLVCGLRSIDGNQWLKGNDVPKEWSRRAATGETLKPRRVWVPAQGTPLPVFVDEEPRLGLGRGRRAVSRVLEWQRASNHRIAVLTNHRQFRLIYAGPDYDASAEWDTALWFEEGKPAPQVEALRWLLGPEALLAAKAGGRGLLLDAIEESRKGQAELSSALGERVRRAVESLIQAYGPQLENLGGEVDKRHTYIAATRVVMRMVVVLFAEARELLPRDNPKYEGSYGLQALRASLERITGSARGRRQFRHGAWPRVLGLFRLVYEGSHHPDLLIRRYGGGLFRPGHLTSPDPIDRALAVFEDPEHGPHDETVKRMLDLLCRTEMRVRVGHAMRRVPMPVDFSDLSSEYIGILYEGLLDYELRRASVDDPYVFLNLGDQPVLPLSRLEAMDEATVKGLVEKLKVKRTAVAAGDDEGEDEEGADATDDDGAATQEEDAGDDELAVEEFVEESLTAEPPPEDTEQAAVADADHVLANETRAHEWAVRAVKVGGLVSKPRGRRADALAAYEQQVAGAAKDLVVRVVQPGEWFLVLWGGTRKGSGTFYTRPQLAVPTVQRTLRHLAYDPPPAGDEAPLAEWIPREPDAILALKVCDPAAGSGSFPVAALRFLTDALWRSLLHHRWLVEDGDRFVVQARGTEPPPWFSESVQDLPVTSGDAEIHIRARLRRVVVERCIYGVDLDPLAVELARLSIWVETMDRNLPFEFLDHRIKVGNALVGCWFDRFRDYPAMAWMREGGDKNHTNFVHHFRETKGRKGATRKGDKWTTDIKEWRDKRVKPDLAASIVGQRSLLDDVDGRAPEAVHDEAVALLAEMERIPIQEPEERARYYQERLLRNASYQRLKQAFDTWCALWFWPAESLDSAPQPSDFAAGDDERGRMVGELAGRYRFFHWELEFPDVFLAAGSGFDAIIGNPPWEIQKPNSKEFFSNIDPLYRGYGKQEALKRQKEYFEASVGIERDWVGYAAHYKALGNWNKYAATPFGDPNEGDNFALERGEGVLHQRWRDKRASRLSYADSRHPFCHQGSADINTYKMFLEQAHGLLNEGGKLGMIVPSGVYTDKGSSALRELFLEHCRWEWLFGFENRDKIFDIHRSFKFCPIVVQKGGHTEAVRAAFMRHDLRDWEEADRHIVFYPRRQVTRFSPGTRAILEVRDRRDLEVLEKIYANSVLLGDTGPDGWGITYAREFDMTNDSNLFPPRPVWEAKGYRPDEYGRWIKFRESQPVEKHPNEVGWIRLADGSAVVHEEAIEDIALPLYEGRLYNSFDFAAKRWVSGRGLSARWEEVPWERKEVWPQYLITQANVRDVPGIHYGPKVAYRNLARNTDTRSFIATCLIRDPTPHVTSLLVPQPDRGAWPLTGFVNSYVFDHATRVRLGGTHLDFHVISELPLPVRRVVPAGFDRIICRLANPHRRYAPEWLRLFESDRSEPWQALWAVTPHERARLRAICDAVVAAIYGLDFAVFRHILRDCDHPVSSFEDRAFVRDLNTVGFWRVDRRLEPELRQPILALIAFRELEARIETHGGRVADAVAGFLAQNSGQGWMIPEEVCLADYGLGHDARAKSPQPVRERFGARSYPWQSKHSVSESWVECERHARNLLGPEAYERLVTMLSQAHTESVWEAEAAGIAKPAQKRLFSRERAANLFDDGTEDPV